MSSAHWLGSKINVVNELMLWYQWSMDSPKGSNLETERRR
jgi:hypothetical protein